LNLNFEFTYGRQALTSKLERKVLLRQKGLTLEL